MTTASRCGERKVSSAPASTSVSYPSTSIFTMVGDRSAPRISSSRRTSTTTVPSVPSPAATTWFTVSRPAVNRSAAVARPTPSCSVRTAEPSPLIATFRRSDANVDGAGSMLTQSVQPAAPASMV